MKSGNASVAWPACPEDAYYCGLPSDWFDEFGNRVGSWWSASTLEACGCMIACAIVLLVVTWYVAQVFSAGTGSNKLPLFPFYPSHWMGISTKATGDKGPTIKKERELSETEGSVRMHKLSKSYEETLR